MVSVKNTLQISGLFEEATFYIKNGNLDDATKLVNKIYNYSLNINFSEGITFYYKNMITIFMITSENHRAITYFQKLIVIYKNEKERNELGNLYVKYGTILTKLKDYKNAQHYLNMALDINTSVEKIDYKLICFTYIALSFNSNSQQNNFKALQYINWGINFIKDKKDQIENLRSLLIYKTRILIDINKIKEAKILLDKIKKSKSRNRNEEIEINYLDVKLLFERCDEDEKLFLQKINSCIKNSIEISDTEGMVEMLQLLKRYYLNKNDVNQAYKYANEIIEIEYKDKNKQISVIDLHERPLERIQTIEEDFEIYSKFELEVAANYQQNSYSNKFISNELNIQTLYKPSNTLSGDYIGTFDIGSNKFLMVLADVVGKGITASYISFLLDGIINTVIRTTGTFLLPNNICDINAVISNSLRNKGFVSLWAGIIDTNLNEIESVNAGHLPVYLIRNDEIIDLTVGSTILGMFDKLPSINSEKNAFNSSDAIIAYSDGVTESINENGEDYDNNFKLLVKKYAYSKDFSFIEQLTVELKSFQDEKQIQDDVSCLFVERN